jgi:hypothetical protein
VFDFNAIVWTYLDIFGNILNTLKMEHTFLGWEVGSCDFLFKPPKKYNIYF